MCIRDRERIHLWAARYSDCSFSWDAVAEGCSVCGRSMYGSSSAAYSSSYGAGGSSSRARCRLSKYRSRDACTTHVPTYTCCIYLILRRALARLHVGVRVCDRGQSSLWVLTSMEYQYIIHIYIYIYIFNRNLPYFLDTPNCVILNDQLELDLDDIIIK